MTHSQPSRATPSQDRRIAMLLAIMALALYGFSMRGYLSLDEEMMFTVTEGIFTRGDAAITDTILSEPNGVVGADGRLYAFYDLGQSLVGLLFYWVGQLAASFIGEDKAPFVGRFAVNHVGVVFGALAVAYAYLLARRLRLRVELALAAALLLMVATPLWYYSRTFFRAPVLAFCLTAMAYHLFRCRAYPSLGAPLIAGALLGLALLVKGTAVLFAAPVLLYLYLSSRAQELPWHWFLARSVAVMVPVILCMAVSCAYNDYRWGQLAPLVPLDDPFSTPILYGLFGLLASPGRGLLLYCPTVLIVVLSLSKLSRQVPRRLELSFMSALFLIHLCVHAKWIEWHAGSCWGPRFLVPMLPFLMVALGCALEGIRPRSMVRSLPILAGSALVIWTFLLQVSAVTTDGSNLHPARMKRETFHQELWWPEFSPALNLQFLQSPRYLKLDRRQLSLDRDAIRGADFRELRQTSPSFWWAYLYRSGMPFSYLAPMVGEVLLFFAAGGLLWRARRRTSLSASSGNPPQAGASPA